MDEPMQFFENIKTAVDRNFGKGKGLEGINLPEMGSDAAPVKAKDLKSSPFKPLVNTGETIETEPQTKPAEAVTPVAEKPAVEEEENDVRTPATFGARQVPARRVTQSVQRNLTHTHDLRRIWRNCKPRWPHRMRQRRRPRQTLPR